MKWPWLRFPFTSVALALAYVVLAGALVGDIHLIELPAGFIARIQQAEIDAIVLVLLLLGVAFLVDQAIFTRRINQMARLHVERLRVVQVTIGGRPGHREQLSQPVGTPSPGRRRPPSRGMFGAF